MCTLRGVTSKKTNRSFIRFLRQQSWRSLCLFFFSKISHKLLDQFLLNFNQRSILAHPSTKLIRFWWPKVESRGHLKVKKHVFLDITPEK